MSGVRKAAWGVGLLLGIAALLAPLVWFALSALTVRGRELVNFTHAPMFAVTSLLLLHVSDLFAGTKIRSRWIHYALAAAVASAVAVATEVAQYFGDRDADVWDLARNLAGVVIGLVWFATADRRLVEERPILAQPRARRLMRAGALLVLVGALAPVGMMAWAYHERAQALPLLRGFDARWERTFFDGIYAVIETAPPPPGWSGEEGDDLVGQVTFSAVSWPSVAFEECYPDWTAHDFLLLDLYSDSPGEHRLWIIVEDVGYAALNDRFNYRFVLPPGATTVRIPLADVRSGPEHRDLDLARVRNVRLVAEQPREAFTIWVDDLRLERGGAGSSVRSRSRARSRPPAPRPRRTRR
jgi:hypothetical protein